MAWGRKIKRPYRPTSSREADAAVARIMRDLDDMAFRAGVVYVGKSPNGKWVQKVAGGVVQEAKA